MEWGDVEFSGPHAFPAPGLQKFAVAVEFENARVVFGGAAAIVAIGYKEIAISEDGDFRGPVEPSVGAACGAPLSKCQEHFAIRTQFEDLVAAIVGDPEIALVVDRHLVRGDEQTGANVLQ